MGRRHIFNLVQLNTSCFDFVPTSQKQRGLNDEGEIKQGRKAWSTRSTSGIRLSLPWPLKSLCCCRDVQRGELTCAAFSKSCLCHCPEPTVTLLVLLGKQRELGKWCGRSPLRSPSSIFSEGREGQCLSVHTSMGPSSVPGLAEDLGKAGAIPIMATDVGMVFSKLGLASHGSCQAV